MTTEPTKGVKNVEHVGIVVDDLAQAVDYYSKALGIGTFRVFESIRRIGGGPPAKFRVALGQAGNLFFEIMEVIEGTNLFKELRDTRGEGVHIAFLVDDVEKELERVKEHGLRVISTGIGTLSFGGSFAIVGNHEPGGILIQFLQTDRSLIDRVAADGKEIAHQKKLSR